MQSEKSLKDHVINGTEDDLKVALEKMQGIFLEVSNWIIENKERNN